MQAGSFNERHASLNKVKHDNMASKILTQDCILPSSTQLSMGYNLFVNRMVEFSSNVMLKFCLDLDAKEHKLRYSKRRLLLYVLVGRFTCRILQMVIISVFCISGATLTLGCI